MKNKILVVVTNEDKYKTTGDYTGLWLGELAHFYDVMAKAGIEMDIISAQGGRVPLDPISVSANFLDDVTKSYYEDGQFMNLLNDTKKADDVNAENYDAIYFTGGHGTMWDFPNTRRFQELSSKIYENEGIVSAVCHGVGALLNIELEDGKLLIEGKNVTGYSNNEEVLANAIAKIPFRLEDELRSKGAKYNKAEKPFIPYVINEERVITGQNPQSTRGVAETVLRVLKSK